MLDEARAGWAANGGDEGTATATFCVFWRKQSQTASVAVQFGC